ncbi:hypothetical protein FRC12_012795, partial [Ceratobasidium sp. 428]
QYRTILPQRRWTHPAASKAHAASRPHPPCTHSDRPHSAQPLCHPLAPQTNPTTLPSGPQIARSPQPRHPSLCTGYSFVVLSHLMDLEDRLHASALSLRDEVAVLIPNLHDAQPK